MEDTVYTSKSDDALKSKVGSKINLDKDFRKISVGQGASNVGFCTNTVITARYTLISWVPKSILMQFTRLNNVYFLIMSILSVFPFSPKNPFTLGGTLALVIIFTMFKEGYEDIARHKQDKAVNTKPVKKYSYEKNRFIEVETQSLAVGDIIQITENENFPADLIMVANSHSKGIAFINTMNLDGETNLKEKITSRMTTRIKNQEDLHNFVCSFDADFPNASLVRWNCNIRTENSYEPMEMKQLLLRGCVLKNTDWVYAVVIYTGDDSKIILNSKKPPNKSSKTQKVMNWILVSILIFQVVICFVFAGIGQKWIQENKNAMYIDLPSDNSQNFILRVLTFWVAYSSLIPISLYIALELLRLFLSNFINNDLSMYYEPRNLPAMCRSSNLLDELGQVEFIFSDKTGTLTCNEMEFRKCGIHNTIYGSSDKPISEDQSLIDILNNRAENQYRRVDWYFKHLSLCNSVFPVRHENEIVYQASSPDELALVNAARSLGYFLTERSEGRMYVEINKKLETWDLLVEIPFNSDRKRMSVVLKEPETGRLVLFTKGADTMMLKLIKSKKKSKIQQELDSYAVEGLRTLVMAYKELDEKEFDNWFLQWKKIQLSNMPDKENLLDEQGALIETDLKYVGNSAIEDKLQDGVPSTIKLLMEANIKIWVLTGDKEETAIEIAKSCNLFQKDMEVQKIFYDHPEKIENKLKKLMKKFRISNTLTITELSALKECLHSPLGIAINGIALSYVLENPELKDMFFKIGFISNSCVCCRVSPAQKMHVVKLCKSYGKWVTLAVGDGANDVSMIQEAHIGIGIAGKEGTQAVQASEFSIGQFKYLKQLLLVHGRYAYLRVSLFILYYFYKNFLSIFPEMWFIIFNGSSGQNFFVDWLLGLCNVFWTSWPCLAFFTLEQDVSPELSLKFPKLYLAGQLGEVFNMKNFWMWLAFAFHSSAWIFWLPILGLGKGFGEDGHQPWLWWYSTVSFIMMINIVNIKLLLSTYFWTRPSMFTIFLSFFTFYVMTIILNVDLVAFVFQPEFTGLFFKVLGNGKTWIITIFGAIIAVLPDLLYRIIKFIYFPSLSERAICYAKMKKITPYA